MFNVNTLYMVVTDSGSNCQDVFYFYEVYIYYLSVYFLWNILMNSFIKLFYKNIMLQENQLK